MMMWCCSEEWDHTIVLGLPSVHPKTSKQIVAQYCYPLKGSGTGLTTTLFRASVNAVGDKFGSGPTGLGFRHRGAPERRNGTKS